jgi:endonuclease/exonuclease/phosphatase family metal-dependent hydrolase
MALVHDPGSAHRDVSDEPGLVIIQIDGLSANRLRHALDTGLMPFVAGLVERGDLGVVDTYSGVPSTTPAVQGELFYGVEHAVPAFAFVDHRSQRVERMYQHDAAASVEQRLQARTERALLAGGASYANVYTGGALDARFCMATLGLGDALPRHRRWLTPVVALAHLGDLVRLAGRVAAEAARIPGDLAHALGAGEDRATEIKFALSRIAVGVVLSELTVLGAAVDMARGLPIVHVNLLGYDENAHRRGPDSALARRALRPTDAAVARLWRAAHRGIGRDYQVWIISDHGQEHTESYVATFGITVAEAIGRVAGEIGLIEPASGINPTASDGVGRQRARLLGERLAARLVPGLDTSIVHHRPGVVTVTAQGPFGHVYGPRALTPEEAERFALAIVERAGVPLVLRAGADPTTAIAYTPAGRFVLPDEASEVFGAEHRYLEPVTADVIAVCHHPDAGVLAISGWRRDGLPFSFPFEHGSHAGPGPDETASFALVPPETALVATGQAAVVRPRDLRRAALAHLDGAIHLVPRSAPGPSTRLRVMTYNVHGAVGLDAKLSPERIARVVARHDPDVVCLQELDVGRSRSGGVDQARLIAEALGMALEFHPTITVEQEQFGDAVLSRHPLRAVRAGQLPGLGRAHLEPRGALWVDVDLGDAGAPQWVPIITTHWSLHPRERALAAGALMGPEWLGHDELGDDVIMCGDFNALSWFPSLRRLRARLHDVQIGLDGHRPRRTWSGRFPIGRIDHVLVGPAWSVARVEVPDHQLARVASDHRPVIVELRRTGPS